MEEKIKLSILLEIYGSLLTDKQYEVLDDYFNNDLSLSEIAENNNITRQAVNDIINKSKNKLFEYEEKLLFMNKTFKQEKIVNKVIKDIEKLENKELTKTAIDKLVKELKQINE